LVKLKIVLLEESIVIVWLRAVFVRLYGMLG